MQLDKGRKMVNNTLKGKNLLFLTILSAFLISGCSDTKNNGKPNEAVEKQKDVIYSYTGPSLTFAIVGEQEFPEVEHVTVKNISLDELTKTKDKIYDAAIITKDQFEVAEANQYADFYQSSKFPIFFYGTEKEGIYAFIDKGVTFDKTNKNNLAFVQGFHNNNGNKQYWDLYISNKPSEQEKNHTTFYRLIELIANKAEQELIQ